MFTQPASSNDITGIAALDPVYSRKAQQIQNMPLEKQLDTLVAQGIDARTALLVLKAKRLKELAKTNPNQQANQANVEQEVNQAFQQYMARKAAPAQGLPSLPVREDMYEGQNFAKGGIVAFTQGGGMPQGNPQAGMTPNPFAGPIDTGLVDFGPYGRQGVFSAQSAGPYQAVTPKTVDPVLVNQYLSEALNSGDDDLTASLKNIHGVNVDRSKLDKILRDTEADIANTPLANKDAIYESVKAKAKKAGLGDAEANFLAKNELRRAEAVKYYGEDATEGRGLVAAGSNILEEAERNRGRISNNPLHQLAAAVIAGGGAYAKEKSASKQNLLAAQMQFDKADMEAKSAIARNNMGLIDKSDKEYKDTMDARNELLKRRDEAVKYDTSLSMSQAAHNSSLAAQRAQIAAYGRNPDLRFQPGLVSLVRRRAEAEAAGKPESVAAVDAALDKLNNMRTSVAGMTPQGYSANVKAAAQQAAAQLRSLTALQVAGMGNKEIAAAEQMLGMLELSPEVSAENQQMIANAKAHIARRKQELGIPSGGAMPSGAAPAGGQPPIDAFWHK